MKRRSDVDMQLEEVQKIIGDAGGSVNALAYADALLPKINRVGKDGRCRSLLTQLHSARQAGDLRGRLLEVNFADLFLQRCQTLKYGAKQGMTGDIDFCWHMARYQIYIELKLLGEAQVIKHSPDDRIDTDTRDIVRLQRDLMQKSSTKKFNSAPKAHWINLVGVDVTELQLGTVDVCDCLLAAGGNTLASRHCNFTVLREDVVGVFEILSTERISPAQEKWIADVIRKPDGAPHPRDYIHGALFLFREQMERAALAYDLSAAIVWNPALISQDVGQEIASAIHEIIPCARM